MQQAPSEMHCPWQVLNPLRHEQDPFAQTAFGPHPAEVQQFATGMQLPWQDFPPSRQTHAPPMHVPSEPHGVQHVLVGIHS